MSLPKHAPHDLSLFLHPGDEGAWLGGFGWTDRAGRTAHADFYVVLHRRHGAWTHLYRVAGCHGPQAFQVFLERAVPGDARQALADWLLSRCVPVRDAAAPASCPSS